MKDHPLNAPLGRDTTQFWSTLTRSELDHLERLHVHDDLSTSRQIPREAGQPAGHQAAENSRRVDDVALRTRERCNLGVVEQLELLVPGDVLRLGGVDHVELEGFATDAPIEVVDHSAVPTDGFPDVPTNGHGVDRRDDNATECVTVLSSVEALLMDRDLGHTQTKQLALSHLDLVLADVVHAEHDRARDVAVDDDVRVPEFDLRNTERRQRRQCRRPDTTTADDDQPVAELARVEDPLLIRVVDVEGHDRPHFPFTVGWAAPLGESSKRPTVLPSVFPLAQRRASLPGTAGCCTCATRSSRQVALMSGALTY